MASLTLTQDGRLVIDTEAARYDDTLLNAALDYGAPFPPLEPHVVGLHVGPNGSFAVVAPYDQVACPPAWAAMAPDLIAACQTMTAAQSSRSQTPADQWPPTLALAQDHALNLLAAERYRRETAGLIVDGHTVLTDRQSQALITGAHALALAEGPGFATRFKTADGFVTLDQAQVIALAVAVGRHIQACFAREAEIAATVAAARTVAEVRAVDLESGWP